MHLDRSFKMHRNFGPKCHSWDWMGRERVGHPIFHWSSCVQAFGICGYLPVASITSSQAFPQWKIVVYLEARFLYGFASFVAMLTMEPYVRFIRL